MPSVLYMFQAIHCEYGNCAERTYPHLVVDVPVLGLVYHCHMLW